MGLSGQKLYLDFKEYMDDKVSKQANFIIVTIPGLGMTHCAKKYLEEKSLEEVKYINSSDMILGSFNLLDLNFDKNPGALQIAEKYFKEANLNQKFGLIINTPKTLKLKAYSASYISSHIYSSYYFRTREKSELADFLLDIDEGVTDAETDRIYALSGGIVRLAKFLVFRKNDLGKEADEWSELEDLKPVLETIGGVIYECDAETLLKMGLVEKGKCKSEILKVYLDKRPMVCAVDIIVKPDLTLVEDGVAGERLTKQEGEAVKQAMGNEGVISKEKISDIKWGEGSYDQYSDQAIGKTMQRLNKKMKKYCFGAIRGMGYKIVKRHGT